MKVTINYEISEQEISKSFELIDKILKICEPMANAAVAKQVEKIKASDPKIEDEARGKLFCLADKMLSTAVKAATASAKSEVKVEE